MRPRRTTAGVFVCQGDETPSRPHETLDFIVVGSILVTDYPQLLNGKLLRRMLRKGDSAWQARIEGLVECSCSSRGPSHFSCPESAVGLPWLGTFDSRLHVLFIRSLRGLGSTALTVLPKGEEYDMRKALSVFIAVCLVLSLCTGVFAPVPESRAAGPALVDLGTVEQNNFVVLAETGISTSGPTSITGNIGVNPISGTGLTGFSETMDASNIFSTSTYVVAPGKLYAATYAVPTPATVGQAVYDMQTAYTAAANAATPAPITEVGAGTLGAPGENIFYPNIYKWTSNVTIANDITLSGGADDVFIFQIDGTLDISVCKKIILTGGAQAKNIFWKVAGAVNLLAGSHFEGNILAQTNIALENGASINGRLLAQSAVTLLGNAVYTTYTVTASAGSGGTVTPLTQTVAQGLYATVTITAPLGSWIATGGLVDSVDGPIAAADHLPSYTYTTITPVTGDRT